jgi:hypothetical protein
MLKHTHPIEREELMAYLDGELPVDRAARAAAHLENCRECQDLAADLQSATRRMMTWQIEPSDLVMKADIAEALNERKQPRRGVSIWKWGLAGTAVAALSGCIIIGLSLRTAPRAQYTRRESRLDLLKTGAVLGMVASEPKIAHIAQLTLTTTEFDKTRPAVDDILKRHQGYFGQLNINASAGLGRTLEATLRVPTNQRDAAIAEIRNLGHVESESQTGEEVTAEYVDREARLSNARNTEQRLTELLRQRTGKLSDVMAVELEIGRVRGEIERMQAEQKSLLKRVDFATIDVKVTEDYEPKLQVLPDSILGRLRNSAIMGYRNLLNVLMATFSFVLSAGPTILMLGSFIFFPARFIWKKLRK